MNYAVIVDFSKDPNAYEVKRAKTKASAFIEIESIENEARSNAVEQSTLDKPYVCKMSNKRFGFIIPKSFISSKDVLSYVKASLDKIEKKHGLSFNGKLNEEDFNF